MSVNTYELLKNLGFSEQRVIQMLPGIGGRSFAAHEILWPRGQAQQPWTHVLSGLVCASIPEQDGGFNPIAIYGPGTWFGEAAFLSHRPSALEYVCLTPVRALQVPFEITLGAFENDPAFARYMARLVTWRDQQHGEKLTLMRIGSPAQRVVLGLALLAEAMLSNSSHLPGTRLDDSLEIPLKQALLASLCGVTRGVLSVCLKQLAAAGWCHVHYATVTLRRLKTWGSFSDAQRHNRLSLSKSSMPELLSLMDEASVTAEQLDQNAVLST